MERLKKEEGTVKWRKNEGGSFHLKGQIIKPGQIFYAKEEEIVKSFRDVIECLEPEKLKNIVEKKIIVKEKEVTKIVYFLKENKSASSKSKILFDIVNAKGKILNEEPMSKKEGEETIKTLE